PLEEVFSYWSDFERFPEFMDHLQSIRMTGERRSHWKVRGPLGGIVEWDAEITTFVPNERIGWRTADRALVKHAGIVRFEPADDARARRLDVHFSSSPVAGSLGHGVARLFGVDPKTSFDEDLLRLKSLLEEGKATAHGHEVRHEIHEPAEPAAPTAPVPSE